MKSRSVLRVSGSENPNQCQSVIICGLLLLHSAVLAGSAHWNSMPATNDWNTAGNWTPDTVPNGPIDTAEFNASATTNVLVSAATQVNSIAFAPGASPYTITALPNVILEMSGVGLINVSSSIQNFVSPSDGNGGIGTIRFTNN